MENINKKIVTRFAPSPTGFLHIGGIRTALYAWAYAKKNNGTFILRIEDTDKAREVPGSIEHIIESLKWIGIYWQEGPDIGGPNAPYKQSDRLDSYQKYAKVLVEKGLAYADPYTEEEVESFRKKADEEKRAFLYRDHRPENPPVWDGTKPLRFKITNINKSYEWEDAVRGKLKAGPEALDDFVLIKSDGYPTYNFAHIIDDLEMGVTHVMRADEFISSTPKFLALYEALEIERPILVTLPPIMGADGKKKLGKRDGAKDFLEYKKEGYLPEAMINFLAFIGWNPGGEKEILTKEEFINLFDIKQIHISGGGFNIEKLDWINKEHIKKLSNLEYLDIAKKFTNDIEFLNNLEEIEINNFLFQLRNKISKFIDLKYLIQNSISCTQGNITSITESINQNCKSQPSVILSQTKSTLINIIASGPNDYLFKSKDPVLTDNKLKFLIPAKVSPLEVLLNLKELLIIIDNNNWEEIIQKNDVSELWVFATNKGRGKILWPLRVALSGEKNSPDPFEIMCLIGKESTIRRMNNVINYLGIYVKNTIM